MVVKSNSIWWTSTRYNTKTKWSPQSKNNRSWSPILARIVYVSSRRRQFLVALVYFANYIKVCGQRQNVATNCWTNVCQVAACNNQPSECVSYPSCIRRLIRHRPGTPAADHACCRLWQYPAEEGLLAFWHQAGQYGRVVGGEIRRSA